MRSSTRSPGLGISAGASINARIDVVTSDRIDEWIDVRIGRILDVSADLLGPTGYDGFQLREVGAGRPGSP